MTSKEDTYKKRYSFKKGSEYNRESQGNKYLYNGSTFRYGKQDISEVKGIIDNEWDYQFQYYAETIEQYETMNTLIEKEKEILFSQEMKKFIEHPMLICNNKKKHELEELINSLEYNSIKKEFIECLINIDEEKYPTISWVINNLKSRSKYRNYWKYGNCRIKDIKDELDIMIDMIVRTNHSLKNFIKIMHPKDAEFIIRSNYIGKSEPEDNNKNRNWRKRKETNRRRKERRETKKQITFD